MKTIWVLAILLGVTLTPARSEVRAITGFTFADSARLYVAVRTAASALGWQVRSSGGAVYLNNEKLDSKSAKELFDGTRLIYIRDLGRLGANVHWEGDSKSALVTDGNRGFRVAEGAKKVVVDREKQQLRAYQGDRLVLKTRISTGAKGQRTPAGTYKAGPYKARMHYSTLYNNAPMPYSVQLDGDIFIHGFRSVPRRPASHGCIRVPLAGRNPAKWFYHWVDIGTPVTVKGEWRA